MAVQAANLRHLESGLLILAPAALANGDTSSPADLGLRAAEIAWQAKGAFGVGGSIQLEKSNDGSAWVLVGVALTVAGMAEAVTAARFLRFNVTAGDGTTALTPVLIAHPARG